MDKSHKLDGNVITNLFPENPQEDTENVFSEIPKKTGRIYQLKITLKHSKPPIWRRILVRPDITFEQLHFIIQVAFGWENAHLFQFDVDGQYILMTEGNDFEFAGSWKSEQEDLDASETGIHILEDAQRCVYEYDFGDSWIHTVVLEKILEEEPGQFYPVCTQGRRSCPPEDVGGIGGYEEFLNSLSNSDKASQAELMEWATGDIHGTFDPEYFNLEEVNTALEQLTGTVLGTRWDPPSLEQWQALYEVAANIRQLRPWDKLWDNDIVTIQLPGHVEPVFISVMGRNGDCLGIGVYPGYGSLDGLRRLQKRQESEPIFVSMSYQDCMLCYFGEKDELHEEELSILKQLDIHPKGKNQWIYFRSMSPGFYPWFLNSSQADLMLAALQNFFMAYQHFDSGELSVAFEQGMTLLRHYSSSKKLWLNEEAPLDKINLKYPKVVIDDELFFARLNQCRETKRDVSLDLLYIPCPIQEQEMEIPFLPKLWIIVDSFSGELQNQHLFQRGEIEEDVLMNLLAQDISDFGKPRVIRVRNDIIAAYLVDFCKKTGIKLMKNRGIPAVDKFAEALSDIPF